MRTIFCLAVFVASIPANGATTLDEAFRAAVEKNETAKITREDVVQARERVSQAKGGILPTLSLQAAHQIQDQPSDPIAREFFPENSTTVNLNLTQPLFRGFREFAFLRSQNALLRAQEQGRSQALIGLYKLVASSYMTVLMHEQDLRNLESQVKLYESRNGELRSRARTGESSTTELLSAQTTLAALLAEVELIKGQLAQAREQFQFLTGLDKQTVLQQEDLKKSLSPLPPLDTYLGKIDERPDIKAAKEQAAAVQESMGVAKGAHWPTLDLLGNYYFKRPEGVTNDIQWDVQLRFVLPLYEGGVTQSRIREASSKNYQAELTLARARREAESDVKASYASLKARIDQILALEKAVELSERNSQVSTREFRRGLTRSIDVQLALADYRNQVRLLDRARYGARLDVINLQIDSAQSLPSGIQEEVRQ